MNILQTKNLTKYYGAEPLLVKALDGITLEIEQGRFTAIVGTSGSGKARCSICWAAWIRPQAGALWWTGRN